MKSLVTGGKRVGARASKCVYPKRDKITRTGFVVRAWRRADKIQAIENDIPQSLRRYAKRYGVSIDTIIRIHRQN